MDLCHPAYDALEVSPAKEPYISAKEPCISQKIFPVSDALEISHLLHGRTNAEARHTCARTHMSSTHTHTHTHTHTRPDKHSHPHTHQIHTPQRHCINDTHYVRYSYYSLYSHYWLSGAWEKWLWYWIYTTILHPTHPQWRHLEVSPAKEPYISAKEPCISAKRSTFPQKSTTTSIQLFFIQRAPPETSRGLCSKRAAYSADFRCTFPLDSLYSRGNMQNLQRKYAAVHFR